MSIKRIKVKALKYYNDLGETVLRNVEVSLDEGEFEKYQKGHSIEDLDYGLSGRVIENAEKQIAIEFFKARYRSILGGDYKPSAEEIIAIQEFMNLNNQEFSVILGIDKGSFSNILKRGKMSQSVSLLIIERLGMELTRPGSARRLIDRSSKIGKSDAQVMKQINKARYGNDGKVA